MTRIVDEPAFVLHRHDWSESSLVLDVLTRHQGRVALVAKGVKRPSSSFRPVLLPLQPLRLSFGGEAEIRTLKAAEWVGGHVMPTGEALLSGCYLNELLLRLLPRDDPHPRLYDAYAHTVRLLATEPAALHPAALRAFELILLREAGVLPTLDVQTLTLQDLVDDQPYCLVPEGGLRQAHADDESALTGAQWQAIELALAGDAVHALLGICAQSGAALRNQLRTLLHYHCGGTALHTRQLLHDIRKL
jgi:DNA repair protein RecO (recombination protein O)